MTPVCRSRIGSICLRIGPRIWSGGTRPKCRRRSPSTPSRKSPWRRLRLPEGVVLMDAGYGNDTELRTQLTALGLRYVAGIGPKTSVWPPGTGPLPAPPGKGLGRPPTLLRRDEQHQPIAVKALALSLPREAWQTI